ncbi:hypothetical protein D3C85_966460 [compost metagenome]
MAAAEESGEVGRSGLPQPGFVHFQGAGLGQAAADLGRIVIHLDVERAIGAVAVAIGDLVLDLEGQVVLVIAIGMQDRRILGHCVGAGVLVQGDGDDGDVTLLDQQATLDLHIGEAMRRTAVL